MDPATIAIIGKLLGAIGGQIIEAFMQNDPSKLEKVTDVLPSSDTGLRSEARQQFERERTRRMLSE